MGISFSNITVTFTYQSQEFDFTEWISLLTLCFSPFVAHIIAGVPTPTYLQARRPPWHEKVCLFNPTSIVWRYYAIVDRRVRTKSWSAIDLAASNALFWTESGWDGSEQMLKDCRRYCLKVPSSTHVEFASTTTAKTLIITLQGVQALYSLLQWIPGFKLYDYGISISISSVFFPLAIIGLLRLFAAFWLTEDFVFKNVDTLDNPGARTQSSSQRTQDPPFRYTPPYFPLKEPDVQGEDISLIALHHVSQSDLLPPHSWLGILSKVIFLLPLISLWIVALIYVLPFKWANDEFYTVTTLLTSLFYFCFLTVSIVLLVCYFFCDQPGTTIIPCISSAWYKIYTFGLLIFIIAVIVVASIETRRTSNGRYTTMPLDYDLT